MTFVIDPEIGMPLSPQQKTQIGRQLKAREAALQADIARERDKSEDFRTNAGEVADAGDDSVADLITTLDQAEVGRDLGELRAIGEALQRFPAEDFGECIVCGNDIPYERLKAEPQAVRCVRCQGKFEEMQAGAARRATM